MLNSPARAPNNLDKNGKISSEIKNLSIVPKKDCFLSTPPDSERCLSSLLALLVYEIAIIPLLLDNNSSIFLILIDKV